MNFSELKQCACFGVAGNFTGHLEQAGEASDFKNITVKEESAPKAVFPTYIPLEERECGQQEYACEYECSQQKCGQKEQNCVPAFLTEFPFSSSKIQFPKEQQNVQIEPECAIIFSVEWKEDFVSSIKALCFGASNDCSIRRQGAAKISLKKNWGAFTKGLSENLIQIDRFSSGGILDSYSIASFLLRDEKLYTYGETSKVKTYSYIYEKLESWLIEKLNFQKDEGPAEDIHSYLLSCNKPKKIMVSIGATRYTEFGEKNYLKDKDYSIVAVFPHSEISVSDLQEKILKKDFYSDKRISFLVQEVVL